MRKLITLAFISLSLTENLYANAAMNVPTMTTPEVATSKWSGLKMGVGVGGGGVAGTYKSRGRENGAYGINNQLRAGTKSPVGGPTVGYFSNITPNCLLGAEAGVTFSHYSSRYSRQIPINGPVILTDFRAVSTSTVYFVPQIAYVHGDSKIYLGVGWAGSRWKTKDFSSENSYFYKSAFKSAIRGTIGAAMKYNKATIGAEINYDRFGSISGSLAAVNANLNSSYTPSVLSVLLKWSYDMDFLKG